MRQSKNQTRKGGSNEALSNDDGMASQANLACETVRLPAHQTGRRCKPDREVRLHPRQDQSHQGHGSRR